MTTTSAATLRPDPAVLGGAAPTDEETLAAAAWSLLVEPDDAVAALAVGTWGTRGALDRLRHWDATDTVGEGEGVPARVRRNLLDRTRPRLADLEPRRALDELAALGGHVVLPGTAAWPRGLDDLTAPPFLLWVRGTLPADVGGGGGVALVGSRTASAYGQRVAADLAVHLTERGTSVVSGGAFGIDIAAHRGALAADGPTVAVLAGGVARPYPRAHESHFARIVEGGALVSELAPAAEPRRHRFLTRNRLIAALSAGTVVVEAGLRSGALNTARHARDLGRHLGAVPGPVTSTTSAGCHGLLREGATLIRDAEDVREMITDLVTLAEDPAAPRESGQVGLLDGLSPHGAAVFDALPLRGVRDTVEIARAAGLSTTDTAGALAVLLLAGRVDRVGAAWRRVPGGR